MIAADDIIESSNRLRAALAGMSNGGVVKTCCYSTCLAMLIAGRQNLCEEMTRGMQMVESYLSSEAMDGRAVGRSIAEIDQYLEENANEMDGDVFNMGNCIHKCLSVMSDPSVDSACLSLITAYQVVDGSELDATGLNQPKQTVINANDFLAIVESAKSGRIVTQFLSMINKAMERIQGNGTVNGLSI